MKISLMPLDIGFPERERARERLEREREERKSKNSNMSCLSLPPDLNTKIGSLKL